MGFEAKPTKGRVMSREDDFQKLIDAIWAERDQGRGVRRALAEHPELWPLVLELGLDEFAEEVEEDVEREVAEDVTHEAGVDDDRDHDARDVAPVLARRVLETSRRSAGETPPGFKPSRARRMFAGSAVPRPGVAAWSGRAAID
jgi:hypothetical protein